MKGPVKIMIIQKTNFMSKFVSKNGIVRCILGEKGHIAKAWD